MKVDKVVQNLNQAAMQGKNIKTQPEAQDHLMTSFKGTQAKDVAELMNNKHRRDAL